MAGPDRVEREVTVTRTVAVPLARVFEAWTKPEQVAEWWHPDYFTTTVSELDARPGGAFNLTMHGPDGTDFPMEAVFREVDPPLHLVFYTTKIMETDGPYPQLEVLTSVTLNKRDDRTDITVNEVVLSSTPPVQEALAGMEMGLNQTLDNLIKYLG